jgi:PAS domain S-box-containing protein
MKILGIIKTRIRYKIIFGFVFISLLVGIVSYISLRTIWDIENGYGSIAAKSLPLTRHLDEMKFNCIQLISSTTEYAYLLVESKNASQYPPIDQEKNLIQQSCNSCHKAFYQFEDLVKESFPEMVDNTIEIRKSGKLLQKVTTEFISIKKLGISGTKALDKKEEMEVGEIGFLNAVNNAINHTNERLEKENAQLVAAISISIRNILVFNGLTFFFSILIGILMSRYISKPIIKLTQLTDDMQHGNLDVTIDIKSADEIGVLGRSFNEMARRKKLLISRLEESNQHIKLILKVAGEGIIGLDTNGNHTFVNPKASIMVGYKVEELLGKHSHTTYHHSYQDGTLYPEEKCPIYETIHDGKIHNGEEYFWKKDGKGFPVVFTSIPIVENEMIIGAVVTFRDISESKRAELERQVIYEVLHGVTTTDNLEDLLKLIHRSLKKVLYADNCFVALHDKNTGLFRFPLFMDKFDTTPGPIAMLKSCTAYVFRTGKPLLLTQELFDQLVLQGEVELVGSNSPSWIGVPLQTPSKIIGVLVLQNYDDENVYDEHNVEYLTLIGSQIALVIERKLIEEEILKSNKQLSMINIEKDKFFSIIAHDLRSPFHGLLGLTKVLATDIHEMSTAEITEYSSSMHDLVANLYALLENLLEWAQMQRGELSFIPREINLADITAQNIGLTNQRAIQKGIIIINEVMVTEKVHADEHMLNTVLRNLLSNAVKFTRRDGKIIVRAKKIESEMVEVSVSDTGVGISETDVKKLFKIEEKVNSKGTEGELSTGLGLLLCKEFVEKHSGQIWVESKENVGSTFYFTLKM